MEITAKEIEEDLIQSVYMVNNITFTQNTVNLREDNEIIFLWNIEYGFCLPGKLRYIHHHNLKYDEFIYKLLERNNIYVLEWSTK